MNHVKQTALASFLVKQADLGSMASDTVSGIGNMIGGDTTFEKTMGGLSYVPMVGFLGNLGQGASQLVHGHPWKALGNAALAGGSFLTGGAANDVVKGGIGAGRMAMGAGKAMGAFSKAMPWTTAGMGAVKRMAGSTIGALPRAAMNTRPFQLPGVQSFAKEYPKWVSGGLGNTSNGIKGFAKNYAGTSMVSGATDSLDRRSTGMGGKDQAFDSAMSLGQSVPRFMGQSADPRDLAPKGTPAPFMPMFN